MLKRMERYMRIYSPSDKGEGELLGYFPLSVSYRTSEEVEAGDVLYTNLRLMMYADSRRSPVGGYKRGMVIDSMDGAERYHVLVPIQLGRLWILKAERVMSDGDGAAAR